MVSFLSPRVGAFASLAVAAGLVWMPKLGGRGSAPAASAAQLPAIPVQVGQWQGRPLTVGNRVLEILETDNVSLMEYRLEAGQPVWLAYVAGFGNRAAFHPPEICYVGSHYEVLERGPINVDVNGHPRRFMRLLIGQNNERYEAWYWFTANGRVTHNYYQQQVWLLQDTIRGRHSSGTLVRLSTPANDQAASHQRLLDFSKAWESALKVEGGDV